MFKKKKIGLALSGGVAKGFAHIGILKVLEENNIKIDMIAGSSMGAVIGAMYCADYSPLEIEKIANEISVKNLIDFTIPRKGLIKGDKIENHLRHIFENKKFSDLKKSLFVTAVDILNSQEIVFKKGDIAKAVRTSISLPGIFEPVLNNNKLLVDGSVLDNLPINILKENGADIIIAVSLDKDKSKKIIYDTAINKKENIISSGIISTLLKSFELMKFESTRILLENSKADILLNPDMEGIYSHNFGKIKLCIERGKIEAEKKIFLIKKLISGKRTLRKKLASLFFKKSK